MQCPGCGFDNPEGMKFCGECGTALKNRCPQCGFENLPRFKFCGECGTTLTQQPPARTQTAQRETEIRFHAILPVLIGLLQREGRMPYRNLMRIFGIDADLLSDLQKELTFKKLARDEQGEGLVWTGDIQPAMPPVRTPAHPEATTAVSPAPSELAPSIKEAKPDEAMSEAFSVPIGRVPTRTAPDAERRQLTVMFCDLADSTKLSQQLDPEDLREVVRAYQETAVAVIHQYEGHVAQYLGDGLLIYFGWPIAHEDDAQRALYSGLGIIEEITTSLNPRLEQEKGVQLTVRLGVHTGPVVVGEMGGGGRHENLATGETVNIAARLEGLAAPNTVVISNVTARLVERAFALEDLGLHALKGVAEPMQVLRVFGLLEVHEDDAHVFAAAPFLVGRDEEVGLLLRRWEQSKDGLGQVVLIRGEAGIGKSSLVATVRHHVVQAGYTRMTFRCSPYHTHSALYPVIEHIQRVLRLQPDDTLETKLDKLEQVLSGYSRPLEEVVPLYAALLSVPVPEGRYAALTLTPQQQRQQTQDALVGWLLEEAERQPVLAMWEDLHWADPSTLEMLGLVLEQTPTVPMLHVLTFRPEFTPPWLTRSHMTPITLNRLERPQVEAFITHLVRGKALPLEVVEHIVAKTDGVPLYVEELTKILLEADLLREETDQYVLTGPLLSVTIPDTLQDSLMARLDQLHSAKEVAQLGAVPGREFTYEMLQAVSLQDKETLQAGLAQLVEAELLYQRGRPPRAKFIFQHALIQDAAYASLLKRTRQQVHQRVTEGLEAQFPEITATQPELVAHHYTEAGCDEQAVTYWQQAVERSRQRQAYAEAVEHGKRGIELLSNLPETPNYIQQEIMLQAALGSSLVTVKGFAAAEVEQAYEQAWRRCQQLGDAPQLFPVLVGLVLFYAVSEAYRRGQELAAQVLTLAERSTDSDHLTVAHYLVGIVAFFRGDFQHAQTHTTQGIRHYNARHHATLVSLVNQDPGVGCYLYLAQALQLLGYADQAARQMAAALRLAHELNHPFTYGYALTIALRFYRLRQEWPLVITCAETLLAHADEHGFGQFPANSLTAHGYALAKQGWVEKGMALTQQRNAREHLFVVGIRRGYERMCLHEMDAMLGQRKQALQGLDDVLVQDEGSGGGFSLAECHRLKGELLLQLDADHLAQAEASFQKALDVARHQQAKSWELRAATSLARLWQRQGQRQEAYDLLASVYEWFTEGFDTADLKEAKVLLEDLSPPI